MRNTMQQVVQTGKRRVTEPTAVTIWLLMSATMLLLQGFRSMPEPHHWLNPVFAALLLGLASAFFLNYFRRGRTWLSALPGPSLLLWQQRALRLGIVLFAANISPDAVLSIAPEQLFKLILMVTVVLASAYWIGRHLFRLPAELVLLVSAGLSFCGTSAIFATQSMRQSSQAHLTQSLAVVMVMGLAALGGYSVLMQQQLLTPTELAWFIGSTAPEVAQAVAAGSQLANAAPQAIVAKLSRVCLLLPFLLWLAQRQHHLNKGNKDTKGAVNFPWFILAFIGVLALQMLMQLPVWLLQGASSVSQACLIFAMLASGLQTKTQDLRQCTLRLFGFATLVMLLLIGLAWLLLTL